MSNDDSDIDPVELEVLEANDNSTISTPSRPIPPSISAVWDHPLIELVHIPSTPGKSDGYYWHCRAPGCGKKANGKNATKALAHGARDHQYCIDQHVKPCSGIATQEEIDLFRTLLCKKLEKKAAVKRGNVAVQDEITQAHGRVADEWASKKAKPATTLSLSSPSSEIPTVKRQVDVASAIEKMSTIDGCNKANLDMAIGQMVYCKGLNFSFGECPYFQNVIDMARTAPRGYKAPKRKIIGGEMLDLSFKAHLEHGFVNLLRDAEEFGNGILGDAATIRRCPLVNIFFTSFHDPAFLVDIVDCTDRLRAGEKKDGTFISNIIFPLLEKFDKMKSLTDIVFFDGGSNFQLAGRILQAKYPRITVVHGLEHVLSLVFEDIAKIPVVAVSV